MNIEQAKAIPISKILEQLNRLPKRAFKDEEWYLSPLREEKTASFHVHTKKNVWYDFGEGKGGNGIKLAQEILKLQNASHTISDALNWLKDTVAGNVLYFPNPIAPAKQETDKYRYLLEYTTPIYNPFLIEYLASRGIPFSIASTVIGISQLGKSFILHHLTVEFTYRIVKNN